jgi:hypothetical protein
MRNFLFQSEEENPSPATTEQVGLITASKPYFTACVIVTVLLSVWAGLCAA